MKKESFLAAIVMLWMDEKKEKRVKSYPDFLQRQQWAGDVIPDDKI